MGQVKEEEEVETDELGMLPRVQPFSLKRIDYSAGSISDNT